jgi:hypothetical protein
MSCENLKDGRCTHTAANLAYGDWPSPGVCQICSWYQGPERPPLIQVSVPAPKPVPKKKGLLRKAMSYAKAEASLLVQGPVGDDQYQARVAECLKCPHLKKSEEPGQIGWCKACGCGSSARAELTVKARMPKAKCPVNSWPEGDTKGR